MCTHRIVRCHVHHDSHSKTTINDDSTGLPDALQAITVCLQQIQETLSRMGEGCDPTIYYKRVREYMGGWRNNPRLPQGVVYGRHGWREFYGETGVRFRVIDGRRMSGMLLFGCSESAFHTYPYPHTHMFTAPNHPHRTITTPQAQSAIIPAFDAFLGVRHEMDAMREYLLEMRRYMPGPHVAFIERLEALSPSVRQQVLERSAASDDGLVGAYNTALESLARFRCACGACCVVDQTYGGLVDSSTNPNNIRTGRAIWCTRIGTSSGPRSSSSSRSRRRDRRAKPEGRQMRQRGWARGGVTLFPILRSTTGKPRRTMWGNRRDKRVGAGVCDALCV